MADFIMAQGNARTITGVDKIFTASSKAKELIARYGKEKVANSTIGALLDDRGELMILPTVAELLKELSPAEFAEYAPIAGIPEYLEAVRTAVFESYRPQSAVEAVASPGGTGAIRNAIENYTRRGELVLTADWFWAPYRTICQEIERDLATFALFTPDFRFNLPALEAAVREILSKQDRLLLILNTPAHNPTGYTLTDEDWDGILSVLRTACADKTKQIAVLADIAYMDFAGEAERFRSFLRKLDGDLPSNLISLIAFSMSKSFTLYGMRCGALLCMHKDPAVAAEFKKVCSFSGRGTWSNCSRAPMIILSRICSDPALKQKLEQERSEFLHLLQKRGQAFVAAAEEAGLCLAPYQSGFFISIPCADPDAAAEHLHQERIVLVPLAKGLRVSVASLSEAWCHVLPARIKAALDATQGGNK